MLKKEGDKETGNSKNAFQFLINFYGKTKASKTMEILIYQFKKHEVILFSFGNSFYKNNIKL